MSIPVPRKMCDQVVCVVYETDEEEFEDDVQPGSGGPCHLYGGGERPINKQIPGQVANPVCRKIYPIPTNPIQGRQTPLE